MAICSDNEDLTSIPSISVASDDEDIMVVDSNASSFTGPTSNTVRHVKFSYFIS